MDASQGSSSAVLLAMTLSRLLFISSPPWEWLEMLDYFAQEEKLQWMESSTNLNLEWMESSTTFLAQSETKEACTRILFV